MLVDEVESPVAGEESGNLLAVLYDLDSNALADGRVRLLGLDPDLLEDDSPGLRCAFQRVGFTYSWSESTITASRLSTFLL